MKQEQLAQILGCKIEDLFDGERGVKKVEKEKLDLDTAVKGQAKIKKHLFYIRIFMTLVTINQILLLVGFWLHVR